MKTLALALAVAVLAGPLSALPYHDDTFNYAPGPLSGQGQWTRGAIPNSTVDNPSDHLVIEDGAVKFDWSVATPLNSALRVQWLAPAQTTGMIYAAFDFRMTQAPVSANAARPGFLMFDRSGSGQLRGHVGLRQGTAPNTAQLGISANSQTTVNFTFVNQDLVLNTTYRVMIGYDTGTGQTSLWIGRDDPATAPDLQVFGAPGDNVRRIQLRLSNTDGAGGITNMGIFTLDNLVVSVDGPAPEVVFPHPSKVFLFLLAGQSNMAGRGVIEAEDQVVDPRIVFLKEDRVWRPARDPMHWDRLGFNGVGPALSFARALLPNLPADAVIGLIPAAQGSTPIAQWRKTYDGANTYYGGQYLYPHALSRALEAMQIGTLAGILWNQGENDHTTAELDGAVAYRADLHRLIADLRADLGRPDLPFIAATLGPWRDGANALNGVYLNLPSEVPFTAVVNTLDPEVAPLLVNNPADLPHYLSPSYRLLGQLYAAQTLPLVTAQLLSPKAPPVGLARDGGALRVSWAQLPWRRAHLEVAPALGGTWQPLQTIDSTSLPLTTEYADLTWGSVDTRFYRVRIE